MSYTETTLVTVNGHEFVGKADDFIIFCSQHYEFKDHRSVSFKTKSLSYDSSKFRQLSIFRKNNPFIMLGVITKCS